MRYAKKVRCSFCHKKFYAQGLAKHMHFKHVQHVGERTARTVASMTSEANGDMSFAAALIRMLPDETLVGIVKGKL